jgi:hypothetical protein
MSPRTKFPRCPQNSVEIAHSRNGSWLLHRAFRHQRKRERVALPSTRKFETNTFLSWTSAVTLISHWNSDGSKVKAWPVWRHAWTSPFRLTWKDRKAGSPPDRFLLWIVVIDMNEFKIAHRNSTSTALNFTKQGNAQGNVPYLHALP